MSIKIKQLKNLDLIFLATALLPLSFILGTFVSEFLIFLILFFFFFNLKQLQLQKKRTLLNNLEVQLFIIIYLLLLINTIFSSNIESSYIRNVGFIRLIVFFIFMRVYLDKYCNINKIFKFWTIIFLITIFDLYFEYIFGHNTLGIISRDPLRLVSFLGEEEKIGTYLAGFFFPILTYWVYKILKKKNIRTTTLIFSIFLLVMFVFLPIGQRSVTIKIYFATFIYLLLLPQFKMKIKLYIIVSMVCATIFFINQNKELKLRYYNSILNTQNHISNNSGDNKNILTKLKREYQSSQYWKHNYIAYEMFLDNPVFGVGNKNFRKNCISYKINNENTREKRHGCSTHPHQLYYEFLSEHGFIGLLILYIFFICFFKELYLFFRDKNLFRLGFVCYFIFVFMPLIPSGSFFTSFNITLFFINLSMKDIKKLS